MKYTTVDLKKIIYRSLLIFCILLSSILSAQKFDGLATTPPMGWNSWNTFATEIDEKLVMDTADLFIELGLKEAGYTYIVLDDGWMKKERDRNGNLVPDPIKFPSGMKNLADYVHSKGLKFGLYSCAGATTCAGYPGSRGHEYQDAKTFSAWGVDFLKYDWCDTDNLNAKGAYETMSNALANAKRPVLFSICEWGNNQPWEWGAALGQMWRVSGDITNCWDCEVDHGSWSSWGVWKIINMRKDIRYAAGPNGWNDLDMMEVGNGMTLSEDRSHFALWNMMASPLILGNDIRTSKHETIDILTNKEVLNVGQDSMGIQGFRVSNKDSLEIWAKPLTGSTWAVSFVNMSKEPFSLEYDWKLAEIRDYINDLKLNVNENKFYIRNLFSHKNMGSTDKTLRYKLETHDVLMISLTKKKSPKQP